MTTKLILSKESGENEIRDYFNSIFKLSESDNEFPVNFNGFIYTIEWSNNY